MSQLSNIIIVEGDGPIAQMFCGCCGRNFRADTRHVTAANKQPICLPCIIEANPERLRLGHKAIPYRLDAYMLDGDEVSCWAFRDCNNRAVTTIFGSAIGEVPACKRCAKRYNDLA